MFDRTMTSGKFKDTDALSLCGSSVTIKIRLRELTHTAINVQFDPPYWSK